MFNNKLKHSRFKHSLTNFWVLHTTGWLVHFVLTILISYNISRLSSISFLWIFLISLSGWTTTLLLRQILKRIEYRDYSVIFLALIILLFSFAGTNIWYGLDFLLDQLMSVLGQEVSRRGFRSYLFWLNRTGWVILCWSTFYFVIKVWMNWKEQEEIAEKANLLAQRAQLQMLRYQLNPHFLFNSLNSVRALISEDANKAKEMVTELAEFLRYSLVTKNYSNIPLSNEIEAIKHYFEIEKKRFEEKLEVNFDIKKEAEDFPVLSFIVHPLVENAVKYGMQTSELPLIINVSANVNNNELTIEVSNSGKWIENDKGHSTIENGTGTGLSNIKRRLDNAYRGKHYFDIIKKENLVTVKLKIPKIQNDKKN